MSEGRPAKPKWAIERDRARKTGPEPVWLFGLHAVRDALLNPARQRRRLIVTRNAADRLSDAIAAAGIEPEIADARRFPAPLDPQSVHQGAALEVLPLDWGPLDRLAAPTATDPAPVIVLLDRVTDPHNVGAILRSAEVFGARAVFAPRHHSAPETGALAKAASGALERQPYVRVRNLADAMRELAEIGYQLIGLDGSAEIELGAALSAAADRPVGLVLGAEGPGLRERTRATCSTLARITPAGGFGSLNVSNAAAIALFASCNPSCKRRFR
jgi:23S rRNA (guanosine2251-2'-O)-methyltransferase